jgi:ABC-2 type transport system permease protein
LPIEALRSLSWIYAVLAVAGSIAVLLVGVGMLYQGLRRYSSGNLMQMGG